MKNREEIHDLCRRAIGFAEGDGVEVLVSASDRALTRFAGNLIHQNLQQKDCTITVKLTRNGVLGQATCNQWDDNSLKKLVGRAAEACEYSKSKSDLPDLLAGQSYQDVDAFDDRTAKLSPDFRARKVERATRMAASKRLEAAGIFTNGNSLVALANSKGLFAFHRESEAEFSLTVSDGDVSGWAAANGVKLDDIEFDPVIEKAVDGCLRAQKPVEIEAGRYTVILPPEASGEFLYFLAFTAFNGLAFNEDRSPFSGRLGEKLFSEKLTILDDTNHPLSCGMPFDFEGVPRQKVTLVENGIVKSVVHERKTAKMAGLESTGHSLPQPNSFGPVPFNLVVEAGDEDVEQMIRSTERGLYVTHFHYTNMINPMEQILTGMTRDGVFLIRDGKLAEPVCNLRFTESAFKAYSNLEMLGSEQKRITAAFGGACVVPGMKIGDFTFTSTTEF